MPFKKGDWKDAAQLTVVDSNNKPVPCEITKIADWEDGSLRWVRVDLNADLAQKYSVVAAVGDRGSAADDIRVTHAGDAITVVTGGAQYTFPKGAACFDNLHLDRNRNGKFEDDEALSKGASQSFYVVDSQGTRSVLSATSSKMEIEGRRHVAIRTEGEYRDEAGKRKAAGVVYYHFYAGHPWVKISHKLIVTEDSNELWFKDIGASFPVTGKGEATATFNTSSAKPSEAKSMPVTGPIQMVQKEVPHFGATNFVAVVPGGSDSVNASVGDWADVSSGNAGLAAQVPGFAEQFPKAFVVSATNLTIKLWASEAGKELDFRTAQVISNYLGHDWIPTNHPTANIANTAAGTAKTHDIWLYPHAGPLTPEIISTFGATKEAIYAYADPSWVATSGAFGTVHPRDTGKFAEQEAIISDYYDRMCLAGDRVFPRTGYLYWGIYPYNAQPWKLQNGRWYPTTHRLSRTLEYNFKRAMWVLFARSGERKYFDYSRKYTRFLHDFIFSNCDAPLKPRGWIVMGNFHSPIVWGTFGAEAIAAGKAGRQPSWNGESSFLSVASSEDIAQFVYDWFLTGDLHSRDMAKAYIDAMIRECDWDADKALTAGGSRPEAFMRLLGSCYDLEHDPRIGELGRTLMSRMVTPDGELNTEFPTGYGKWGEVFGAYYYYYTATGDPLARKALVRLSQTLYRMGDIDAFFARSSPLMQAFAFAYEDTGDMAYAAYLNQTLQRFAQLQPTLKSLGHTVESLNQFTSTPWGQETMIGVGPYFIGVPNAERVLANYKGPRPYLPYAIKPKPTHRTYLLVKKETGAAFLDVYVNNWGDRSAEPQLFDMVGKKQKLDVVEREFHRCTTPDFIRDPNYTKWFNRYEDHAFYKLRIPESVAAGAYHLDLGNEVAFTVLNTDLTQIQQIAPDGVVINDDERYFFQVPGGVETVEFFAYQPVKLADPTGKEVALEDLKGGNYRFATSGKSGAWSLLRAERIPSYVRTKNIPFVLALGEPGRLFEVDAAKFKPAALTSESKEPFVEGKFGQAANWLNRFVEIPVTGLPRERGTVEFWVRPTWSATDFEFPKTTTRMQLFKASPVEITYNIDPNPGNSGIYNQAVWELLVRDAGSTKAQTFFEAGRWYHVALTWNVDGANSECAIFVNGRKKGHYHYARGMAREVSPEKLVAAAESIRFGSGHMYGGSPRGELYDELRVSKAVRYTADFEPPHVPFSPDADTVLLMHLDGNVDATVNGASVTATLKEGSKLW